MSPEMAITWQLPVPTQAPFWQLSLVVQLLPSLHADPLLFVGFEQRPVDGAQVPAMWHWSIAVHVTVVPVQIPDWQASFIVQPLPSLHVVPLALAGFEQTPVDGLHVPAV